MDVEPLVEAGREHLRRSEWQAARAAFTAALDGGGSDPAAYEGLAWACFWLVDIDEMFRALEEAHRAFVARGDVLGAGRTAMWIGSAHVEFRGNERVASGWFRRARRALGGVEPAPEHGWLALHEGEGALFGDLDTAAAREAGRSAAELGRKFADHGLEAVGMAMEGLARVTEGDARGGFALLDEAGAALLSGVVDDRWAMAWCACYLIETCERAQDIERAAQWCREVDEISRRNGMDFAWAFCRSRHASVLISRGEWPDAEDELRRAAREFERQRPPWTADTTVRLAELRRRQGRTDEARELFERVEGHPLALIGRAEMALDADRPSHARRIAERLLRQVPPTARTERARGLELLARSLAALGETDDAAAVVAELAELAGAIGSLPLLAASARCAGALASAGGDPDAARRWFEDAVDLYERAGTPHESAAARLDLADALETVGAADEAGTQRARARATLARLGVPDAPRPAARALTKRECEVLTLVARGLSDRQMAEALHLSEHTVHRHVANILTKLGCGTRAAAVARAVARGEVAAQGVST